MPRPRAMRIETIDSTEELARRAADIVCALVQERPDAAAGLASGKTPLGLYAELARRVRDGEADLSGVTAFAVDELHGVRRNHPATNATYFREHLTSKAPLGALHLLDSEADRPEEACDRFSRLIAD